MDWTDLQKNWAPLGERERFLKYAKENASLAALETKGLEGGSYFEADRGGFFPDVYVYDKDTIPKGLESELDKMFSASGLKEPALLAKITAAAYLKMESPPVSARERFIAWCARRGVESGYGEGGAGGGVEEPVSAKPLVQKEKDADAGEAPPEFWYPM